MILESLRFAEKCLCSCLCVRGSYSPAHEQVRTPRTPQLMCRLVVVGGIISRLMGMVLKNIIEFENVLEFENVGNQGKVIEHQ